MTPTDAPSDPPQPPPRRPGVLIVTPVLDDWESLAVLLARADAALRAAGRSADVLAVDDGSAQPAPATVGSFAPFAPFAPGGPPGGVGRVDVLALRRNLGHQRAIAVGLAYAHARIDPAVLVVMDADGEDDPRDLPGLLDVHDRFADDGNSGPPRVVFAGRARRTEGVAFRAFYQLYKLLHRLLVGRPIRVGNYSVVPRAALARLVVASELWNHYAAAVFKCRLPHEVVPTERGRRYAGRSRMGFTSLVVHGLSALSVYSDTIGVRVLSLLGGLMALVGGAVGVVVAVRLFTDAAVPGWATFTVGLLAVLLVQMAMLSALLVALVLGGRQASTFLPARDYAWFCGPVRTLRAGPGAGPGVGPEVAS